MYWRCSYLWVLFPKMTELTEILYISQICFSNLLSISLKSLRSLFTSLIMISFFVPLSLNYCLSNLVRLSLLISTTSNRLLPDYLLTGVNTFGLNIFSWLLNYWFGRQKSELQYPEHRSKGEYFFTHTLSLLWVAQLGFISCDNIILN